MHTVSAMPRLTFKRRARTQLARRLGMLDITPPSKARDNCFTFAAESGNAHVLVRLHRTGSLLLGAEAVEEPMVNVESFVYHLQGSPGLAVRVAPFKGVWAARLFDGVPQPILPEELDSDFKRRITLVAGAVRSAVSVTSV